MGNMVEISILTDGFDQVEKYPKEFVQTINRAMQSRPQDGRVTYGIGNHGNCLTIHPAHHADTPRVYLADGNLFVALDEYGVEDYIRGTRALDYNLDFVEDEIDKSIGMLKRAKKYVRYLRDEVGLDERPGQPEAPFGSFHGEAFAGTKRRS